MSDKINLKSMSRVRASTKKKGSVIVKRATSKIEVVWTCVQEG